jgi:MbtH protein
MPSKTELKSELTDGPVSGPVSGQQSGEQARQQEPREEQFVVVINDEGQYSIWWDGREVPAGWHFEGTCGGREECIAHIDEVWTDLRPLSLRRRMGGV